MKTPIPGLRPIRNRSIQPAKVQLVIAPGDELHVSEDVAGQLEAASQAFTEPRRAEPKPPPEPTPEPVVEDAAAEEEPAKPKPKRKARK